MKKKTPSSLTSPGGNTGATAFIIACSAKKHQGILPAGIKYNTRQHRLALMVAFLHKMDLYIFSAEFGIIPAARPVPDYNRRMNEPRVDYYRTPEAIAKARFTIGPVDKIYVYGGIYYRSTVRIYYPNVIEVIGDNRGSGDHYSALTQFLYEVGL